MTVYQNATSHGWALAVDFGTSNTAAAVRRPDGQVRILRLSPDADQMPSCVLAMPEGLRVGEAASRSALLAPEAFERTPKVRLGEPVIALGERRWAPGELVAAVLRHVVHHAARVIGGQPPEAVVLTHPADWGGLRQRELHEAAARAGLPRVHLVPEPVAAAAWYLRARRLADGQRVAVFDFGGGTCDVAVLRAVADPAGQPRFAIDASAGEATLGGDHIDTALVDWVVGQLRAGGSADVADALDDPASPEGWLILRDEVRRAKHVLSEYAYASVAVRAGSRSATVQITRQEFDRLIAADVERAIALTRQALDDARVGPSGLAGFYCTGGSSFIPLVHARLTELLGRPPDTLEDPKLVVAMGAAAIAGSATAVPSPEPPRPVPPAPEPPRPVPPSPEPPRPPWPPQPQPEPNPQPVPGPSDNRSKRLLVIALAAVGALILAGGAALAVVIGNRPGTPTPPTDTITTTPSVIITTTPPQPPPDECGTLSEDQCALFVRLPQGFTNDCTSESRTGVAVYLRCPILSSLQTGDGHATTMNAMTFDSFDARDQDLATAKITADYECGPFRVTSDSDGSVLDTGKMYCYQDTDGNAVVLATFDDEPLQLEFDGSTGDSEALHQWVLHGPGLWVQ